MAGPFDFLLSRRPVYVIFHATGACNMSCAHCFNQPGHHHRDHDLTLGEIEKISRNMGHIKYLTLAGGEPLLRTDLSQIARTFHKNNDVHMLNLVTNGWHTDRAVAFANDVLNHSPGLHMSIGVSIDGPEPLHDWLRSKPGSFQNAMNTLAMLKRSPHYPRHLTLAACGTYHAENKDHLYDLAVNIQNTHEIPYYAGLIRGDRLPDPSLKNIDPDHYKTLTEKIGYLVNTKVAPHYPFRHIRITVDKIVTEIIHKSLKHNQQTIACKAGQKGFVLTSDGDILLCEILNTTLGNVRNYDYSPYKILDLQRSRNAIRNIQTSGCHCTWECFQRLNVVFSPKIYPRVLVELVKNMLKFDKVL